MSPTDILNDMSRVSSQEISINFKLTPQLLTAKSYSSAMDQLATCVEKWGSKELDFEVGSGAANSTTEGVFKIRMGQRFSTAGTSLSTTPPSKSTSVLAVKSGSTQPTAPTTISKERSRAVSFPIGLSTSLLALGLNASQDRSHQITSIVPTGTDPSQPLPTTSGPATWITKIPSVAITTEIKARSGAESVSERLSMGLLSFASSASQPLKPGTSINSNVLTSSPGLYAPLSDRQETETGTMINSNILAFNQGLYTSLPGTNSPSNVVNSLSIFVAPVTTANGGTVPSGLSGLAGGAGTENKAAAAGAAAAAAILAGGGSIFAAIAAAGEAASAEVVAAGGSSALADAAKAAAEEAVRQSEESQNEGEEEEERLSFDNQRGRTTAIGTPATSNPAIIGHTTTPNMNTPATSAPGTTTPATTTPIMVSPSRTMTSQVVSSSCAACATCPGFVFGAGWPDLGSTTSWADSDIDTEDDWDAEIDDDEFSPEDADGEEGDVPKPQVPSRRALRGRFSRFSRRGNRLQKRIVKAKSTDKLGKCTGFTKFFSKPSYYNAMNVAAFETNPGIAEPDDKLSMQALLRWAIPLSVPPGDCTTIPKWDWFKTEQLVGDAPLPDGSTLSKVPGVGEQVWQVGGPPNAINPNREVNIDHVYEAKYLNDFFEDLNVNQGFDCQSLLNMWESKDGSKLTNLFANLPSKTNREFIGMAKDLNSLKEAVTNKNWKKDLPLSWEVFGKRDRATGIKGPDTTAGLAFTITGQDAEGNKVAFDPENDLRELTTAAQILDLINKPDAIKYMSGPNDRIYTALQAYGIPCQGGPSWADRYKSYLLNRFATRNVELQDLFNRVLNKLGPNYRTDYMAAWKKTYPIERMQLPPPTSWAAEFPAIQQAMQAQFERDPASLGKRQAGPPVAGACVLNSNTTANGASTTGFRTSVTPISASRVPSPSPAQDINAQSSFHMAIPDVHAFHPGPNDALKNRTLPQTTLATTTPVSVVTRINAPSSSINIEDWVYPPVVPHSNFFPPHYPTLYDRPPVHSFPGILAPSSSPAPFIPFFNNTDGSFQAPHANHIDLPHKITPATTAPATSAPTPVATQPSITQTRTAASATPTNGDPCGPAIQDNPNYPNTCAAEPKLATTPQAYGVSCGVDGPPNVDWTACGTVIDKVCHEITSSMYPKGAWVWNDSGLDCAVGTYMTADGGGTAMTPSTQRCKDLIFKSLTDSCSTGGASTSNVASVNLASLPSFSDPTQNGAQVNVGYSSFIVAGKPPTGLNALPWNLGWSMATFQAAGGDNMNNQDGLTESVAVYPPSA